MRAVCFIALSLGLACAAGAAEIGTATRVSPTSLSLGELSATRDRPLFSPTRRPPPVPVEAPPTPSSTPAHVKQEKNSDPPFDLTGVAVGADATFVLLSKKGSGPVKNLRPGDEQDGWRIGAIGVRSVILERDGRSVSLALTGHASGTAIVSGPPLQDAYRTSPAEAAMTPGPIHDEYIRLMNKVAHNR